MKSKIESLLFDLEKLSAKHNCESFGKLEGFTLEEFDEAVKFYKCDYEYDTNCKKWRAHIIKGSVSVILYSVKHDLEIPKPRLVLSDYLQKESA